MATEIFDGADVSAVKIIDSIIEEAHKLRASDIHIDPQNENIRVRYRVDGYLEDYYFLPRQKQEEIISRVKILAGLRTDEHQIPQDGRFRILAKDCPVDVRVSVAPTYHGENAVLRLLSDNAEGFNLETIGFSKENNAKIQSAAKKSHGMILATGPTGSGKTTTLYALLKQLNTKEVSVVTIEDPVEYSISGIRQIQTNSRGGLTFASGLRGILRQDPNIIMVGEIRDSETAGIAVNAALTGHLLLSTLHTNDAATALPRLLDMKAESYLIASTVNIIIAQRLVRKICPRCKTEKIISRAEADNLNLLFPKKIFAGQKFFYGRGCSQCNESGYSGRTGIHEVLILDSEIREAILRRESSAVLKRIAVAHGMIPMIEDGFIKVQSGITTIEEILRIK